MQQWIATLIGAGFVVLANLLTAAFVYGKLTERVSAVVEGKRRPQIAARKY
jgi:hypothetical protein